jgi:hypothetical protein
VAYVEDELDGADLRLAIASLEDVGAESRSLIH